MSILELVLYPDPKLKEVSSEIQTIDDEIRELLNNMVETMYDAPGIGLAAPQIGKNIRAIVVDVGEEKGKNLLKLINPEIIESSGETKTEEGCLSIPGVSEIVTRPSNVTIRALDEHGKQVELSADGLLAVCLQHEIDHLDGILFIDHLSKLKMRMVQGKLKKLKKSQK